MSKMNKSDFKDITESHLEIAKKIAHNGSCRSIRCLDCPFSSTNSVEKKSCIKRGFKDHRVTKGVDRMLVKSAKKFKDKFSRIVTMI